jgi:hypothetical protein
MSVTGAWNELSPRESGAPTNPARLWMKSESHSVFEARGRAQTVPFTETAPNPLVVTLNVIQIQIRIHVNSLI